MAESIGEIVRKAETNLLAGSTKLGEHVEWSLHDTVEKIFAYLNSRHTTGSQDSLGRDKPFFNIVSAAVNIWYRATDLDRKDIIVLPDRAKNTIAAFLATILLQQWMKKTSFGVFLNQWGRILAQYGSAIVKFVEKQGDLTATVLPWNRAIVDPIDFNALPRIEKFFKTPGQLKNMATPGHPDFAGYRTEVVETLLQTHKPRRNLRGEQVDNQSEFIEIYEVHGLLELSILKESKEEETNDSDRKIFVQQMHVVTWTKDQNNEYIDFTLYSGREKKDPYMITHLIEEDGRTMSIGAVEYLFDSQWMHNHTMKQWKDQMDLASKLIFQTSDPNYVSRNILTNIEQGDILVHADGRPLSQINNYGHDITNVKAFIDQWKTLSQEITSTPDAARGNTMPSGTPYSLGAYLGTQSLSLFEIMTENKGHAIEAMLREFIIPHLKTKLNNKDEIAAMLEDRDVQKLDTMYIPNEAIRRYNKKVKDDVLSGKIPEGISPETFQQNVKQEMSSLGNQRFLSPGDVNWSEVFKDLEWKLDVGITNEQSDKQAVLTTLSTILQTIATNPAILQDPNAKLIFNKILGFTNIVSPVELSAIAGQPVPPATPVPTPQPQGQPQGQNLQDQVTTQ